MIPEGMTRAGAGIVRLDSGGTHVAHPQIVQNVRDIDDYFSTVQLFLCVSFLVPLWYWNWCHIASQKVLHRIELAEDSGVRIPVQFDFRSLSLTVLEKT